MTFIASIATTDVSTLAVSVALYLLAVAPVLAACFYAISRADPHAVERAANDVQGFIALRERARVELAATGSLGRFIAIKDEARKQLWRPASERNRPDRQGGRLEGARGRGFVGGSIGRRSSARSRFG